MNVEKILAKMDYDFENDIFFAMPKKREYDSSFDMENIILDLDKKGMIIGLEILNASEVFNIPKLSLKSIKKMKIRIEVNDEFIKISIYTTSILRNSEKTSTLSLERIRPEFIKQSEMEMAIA